MKIGIVSDTHGNLRTTIQAVTLLEQQHVSAVLHCGDIVSAGIIPLFSGWPAHFVFGNCDADTADLRLAIAEAGQFCHGQFGEIDLDGKRIALLHGDDSKRFQETIFSEKYDLVCYGHTHQMESHREGRTLVLNPGALHRANPHSFAVVDLATMGVTFVPLQAGE